MGGKVCGRVNTEWWRGWIQLWYIWYIVRTFVNATIYPQHNNLKMGKKKRTILLPKSYSMVHLCRHRLLATVFCTYNFIISGHYLNVIIHYVSFDYGFFHIA
jgi:hypothetical protein